jgi:hypothetical protein
VPDDQRDGACNALIVDIVLYRRRDALQTIGGKPDCFRFRRRKVLRQRGEIQDKNSEQKE